MFNTVIIPLIVFFLCLLEIKRSAEDAAKEQIYKYKIDKIENKLNTVIKNEKTTNRI